MKLNSFYQKINIFTETDHAIVRNAIDELPGLLPELIRLHFWKGWTMYQIAREFGISEGGANAALGKALELLRVKCLERPEFSLSLCRLFGEQFPLQAA